MTTRVARWLFVLVLLALVALAVRKKIAQSERLRECERLEWSR